MIPDRPDSRPNRWHPVLRGGLTGFIAGLVLPPPISLGIYIANGREDAAGAAGWMAFLWVLLVPLGVLVGCLVGYAISRGWPPQRP